MHARMAPSSSPRRVLAVLALVAAAGGLLWWSLRTDRGDETSGAPIERARASDDAPPPPPIEAPVLQGAPRAPSPSPPAADHPAIWRLTYEVLDADGTPRHHSRAAFFDRAREEVAESYPEDGPATEGALEVPGAGYLVVWSHHRVPWISAWLEPPASGKRHLVVRLDHGLEIAGVVYASDGVTPIPSAWVRLWRFPETEPFAPAISSRAAPVGRDGSFRIGGFPPGTVKLRAGAYDRTLGVPVELEAEAGDPDVHLVLGPQGALAFLLVDEATGLALQTKRWSVHVRERGEERLWMWGSSVTTGGSAEAKPSNFLCAVPGQTYRIRVEAQGYEASETQVVTIPAEGGRKTLRLALRPAPESVARLTIRVGTDDPRPPEWVTLTHHVTPLSRSMNQMKLVDGRLVLEFPPGPIHLSVGGAWMPDPEDRDTFWVPVDLKLDLLPGEEREIDVWLKPGGWVVLAGYPDPRPREVTFRQGDEVVTCPAAWGMLGKETGYAFTVLPPGTWKLDYVDRKRGCRATVEVIAGEVTRLTPEMLKAFAVEEETGD